MLLRNSDFFLENTISVSVVFNSSSAGERTVAIQKNGSGIAISNTIINPCSSTLTGVNNNYTALFSATNTFIISVFQSSGGALTLIGTATNVNNYCNISITGFISS